MASYYVVTFTGDDCTGLVEALAGVIESHGGNWLNSRLSRLEGVFAGLILVKLSPDTLASLERALSTLPGGTLSVHIRPAGQVEQPAPNLTINALGPDRPGIVKEISAALAAAGISVVTMASEVASAPFTGEWLFSATIEAVVPETVSLARVEEQLDAIAEAMTLELELVY